MACSAWRAAQLPQAPATLACARPSPRPSRRQQRIWASSTDEEEPPEREQLFGGFVRRPPQALSPTYEPRTAACRRCAGAGCVPCGDCGGRGVLARGGYQRSNPINAARVVGSKWTAMERTLGWRHFRVLQKRGKGRDAFVLLAATCDERSQLWVNLQNLKERRRWASGWLQKTEMLGVVEQLRGAPGGAAVAQQQQQQQQQTGGGSGGGGGAPQPVGTACKACGASGALPCPLCSLAGQVVEL